MTITELAFWGALIIVGFMALGVVAVLTSWGISAFLFLCHLVVLALEWVGELIGIVVFLVAKAIGVGGKR